MQGHFLVLGNEQQENAIANRSVARRAAKFAAPVLGVKAPCIGYNVMMTVFMFGTLPNDDLVVPLPQWYGVRQTLS